MPERDGAPHILVIGAHPDDADFCAGGTAARWVEAGCRVTFVSATDGSAGHAQQGGGTLARRRRDEAKAAGDVLGIEYRLLDFPDGQLMPTLEARRVFIQLIREADPDLILTHRPNDYHPDHRYCSTLVQDASYLITVPNVAPLTPALSKQPVIMYLSDHFQKPYPFQADVIVPIDEQLEAKGAMLHAHESQIFEWLGDGDAPDGEADRRTEALRWARERSAKIADRFRDRLVEVFGEEVGRRVEVAEAFEVCEYGAPLTDAGRKRLFPFLA